MSDQQARPEPKVQGSMTRLRQLHKQRRHEVTERERLRTLPKLTRKSEVQPRGFLRTEVPNVEEFDRLVAVRGIDSADLKGAREALEAYWAAGSDPVERSRTLKLALAETAKVMIEDRRSRSKGKLARAEALHGLVKRFSEAHRVIARFMRVANDPRSANKIHELQATFDDASGVKADGSDTAGDLGWLTKLIEAEVKVWGEGEIDVWNSLRVTDELHEVLAADTTRLEQVLAWDGIPEILRKTLEEALGCAPKSYYYLKNAGATRDPSGKDDDREWRINSPLLASGGLGQLERIGSRLHELIHVAAGVSYNNTRLLLCVPRGASADEVRNRVKERYSLSMKLAQLTKTDPALAGFQRSAIEGKIKYSTDRKWKTYVANYAQQFQLDPDGPAQQRTITFMQNAVDAVLTNVPNHKDFKSNKDYLKALDRFSATSKSAALDTLMEWDTTAAQMLLWMEFWRVPDKSPAKKHLIKMCQVAYDNRQEAVASRAAEQPYVR